MTTADLLDKLRGMGVQVWSQGDEFVWSAPDGFLTTDLKQLIVEHRAELITFVQDDSAAPDPILPSQDIGSPLSLAQRHLWIQDKLEPGSPFHSIRIVFRLTGPLDRSVLEKTLQAVAQHQNVLRTVFSSDGGQPRQSVGPVERWDVPLQIVQATPGREQKAEALRLAIDEAARPFDLTRDRLARAMLFEISETEHILAVVMHRMIADEWSALVLEKELSACYRALAKGEQCSLEAPPVQYADYAVWQRERLRGAAQEEQLAYWKKRLAGELPLLELPADHARPLRPTWRSGKRRRVLPPALSMGLQRLGEQTGSPLYSILLAAFQTLLYRYTGQEDILVAARLSTRIRPELQGLIGLFANTVALRTDLSGEPTFRELLRRAHEAVSGAIAHQELPFDKLVEELGYKPDSSRAPFSSAMFTFYDAPECEPERDAVKIELIDSYPGATKSDLDLAIRYKAGELELVLDYALDLFESDTIDRMLGHYQVLLTAIVANLDQSIVTLPLLTEDERQKLLVEWNATAADYPRNQSVHQLFEAQAARTPEATALVFLDKSLCYGELNAESNRLAAYLRDIGVGPDVMVGICMERTFDLVVGLLGILKAGGAYVPLDPTYPQDRLAFMLQDSNTPVLLTQSHLVERLPQSQALRVCVDDARAMIGQYQASNPTVNVTPENLAYVIYTSGSTGKPKGTLVPHRGVVNYLTWCQRAYPLGDGMGTPLHSSISFDLTVTALFAPLVSGRRVALVPEGQGIEGLATVLRDAGDFSLVKITPAHLELLSRQLSESQAAGRTRAFIIGGENLVADSITFWETHAPQTILFNEYGPTETVVGCCVYQVPLGKHPHGIIPIGRPIINTSLYVLDKHRQPVPVGVPGELYIGGAGVSRGYLNRPELTEERFIPDPFSQEPGARLYKTGDLVRYLPDGNLECLGRTDAQVKIRGYRVELGEIEAVLLQHPEVREAAVVVREDAPGDRRLVGYFAPRSNSVASARDLSQYLKSKLPEYMVPATFVKLQALPLTPTGKIDRRDLPRPEGATSGDDEAGQSMRTPDEQLLASIWSQLLGVKRFGIHDNFFDLGGHSLLVMQLAARVRDALHVDLPLSVFFQARTFAKLCAAVAKAKSDSTVPAPARIMPVARKVVDRKSISN